MTSARKPNNNLLELRQLREPLFEEVEEYALMNMVHNIGEQLEKRAKDRKLAVDNRLLLIPGNKIYDYHAQFPIQAAFLHLTWFELMNHYKKDIEHPSFQRVQQIIAEVEAQGPFRNDMYDNYYDYARDYIFEEGDSIMRDVMMNLRDVLIENGCMVGDMDPNRYSFKIAW
ncbi:hypothetical protein [Pseudobacteriovorax antillogorgiicola]|uniref:Uncharacterized protein n=1 Tax=Pseudobacteriovorax antillogorgiicola TaxID=1513793 RepID=A0A1Y6BVR8_9BACT|nr:hypothetical protein [Pseudobacteriovorax antillogorgiicola]TCS52340.1 hypothetical protein EDD56_10984 [Pseudobacteriovorax antillogorgiicola]SMF29754.1 hypothetical protein SAMN06296036_109129 [Pseudobacteriovorax antillogorgiicola]